MITSYVWLQMFQILRLVAQLLGFISSNVDDPNIYCTVPGPIPLFNQIDGHGHLAGYFSNDVCFHGVTDSGRVMLSEVRYRSSFMISYCDRPLSVVLFHTAEWKLV